MKQLRSYYVRHKLIAAVCVLLCCLALSAAMLLPDFAFADNAPAAKTETSSLRPHKAYTSIDVTVPDGLVIYSGVTTAQDVKNNITVKGKYNGGDVVKEVTLDSNEYAVVLDGTVYDVQDTPIITVESDTSLPWGIECNGLTVSFEEADTLIPVRTAVPTYTEIAFANTVTQIEDDHTPETLTKLLAVVGTREDGEGNTVSEYLNKELYTLSCGTLSANTTVTVTATLNADGTLTCQQDISVAAATVQDIFVSVDPSYRLIDGYYKTDTKIFPEVNPTSFGVNQDEYYAVFASGMRDTDVQPYLRVEVLTENGRKPLSDIGATFTVTDSGTYEAGVNTVTVQTGMIGAKQYTDSVSVPFERAKTVRINATYDNSQTVSSSTSIGSVITVTAISNTGVETVTANYTVDGSLAYTGQEDNANGTYDKTVRISDADDPRIYTLVTFTNIEKDLPTALRSLTGTVARQTVGQYFDLRGLNLSVLYGNMIGSIALSEYADEFQNEDRDRSKFDIVFYSNYMVVESDGIHVPSLQVDSADITFTYDNRTYVYYSADIKSVVPAALDRPVVDERSINFKEGVSKTITGLDLQSVPTPLTVTISNEGLSPVTAKYGASDVTTDEQIGGEENGLVYYPATGKIVFTSGGTFTVTFSLTEGGNYGWAESDDYNAKYTTELSYVVKVGKGYLDVRLTDKDGALTQKAVVAYSGDLDTDVKNALDIACFPVGSANKITGANPAYSLRYYGFTDESGTTYTYDAPSTTAPQNVGTYKVFAVTEESAAYHPSTTYEANAITLQITPMEIAITDVTAVPAMSAQYDRTVWTQTDILDNGKIAGTFLAKDIPSGGIVTMAAAEQILHVKAYTVTFTLHSKNYVWTAADGSTDTVTKTTDGYSVLTTEFTITQYTTPSITVSFTGGSSGIDGFTYSAPTGFAASAAATGTPFYAAIQDAAYYPKTYFDGVADKTQLDTAQAKNANAMDTWDAGEYVAYVCTKTDTDVDKDGDYTLPDAYREFTVRRKAVAQVSLSTDTLTYDATAQTVVVHSFDAALMDYKVVGTAFDNTNITDGITRAADDSLLLVHAGTYTVTVFFRTAASNNYCWAGESALPSDAPDEKELQVAVAQLAVKVSWDTDSFDFAENTPQKPTPTYTFADAETKTPTLTVKIYKRNADGTQGAEITDARGPIDAGGYVAVITGVSSADYVIPTVSTHEFFIGQATLYLPSADGAFKPADGVEYAKSGESVTLTAVYRASAYTVETYFVNYTNNVTVTNVTVRDADTYTLTVTPTANYVWESKTGDDASAGIQITFVVKPYTVTYTWDKNSFVYNGNVQKPIVQNFTTLSNESVGTITYGGDDAVTDAGNGYSIKVVGIANTNYKLSDSDDYAFVILKKGVSIPALTKDSIVFGESGNAITFAANVWSELYNIQTVTTAVQFTAYTDYGTATATANCSFTISASGFTFAYTDAGTYTVTFTLPSANYRWGSDGDQANAETDITVTVQRKKITVTGFGNRQLTWSENGVTVADGNVTLAGGGALPTGLSAQKKYGKVTVSDSGIARDNWQDSAYNTERGVYSVRYTLQGDATTATVNPYNYMWELSPLQLDKDTDKTVLTLLGGYDAHVALGDNNCLFVHYAISSQLLDVAPQIKDYIFGDNLNARFLQTNFTVSGTGVDAITSEAQKADKFSITVTVYADSAKTTEIGSFTYHSGSTQIETESTALVNGLPWNAGTYYVMFEWDFADETSDYFIPNSTVVQPFTVAPLVLTNDYITWSGDAQVTYDGQAHTFTATAKNLPARDGNAPALTLSVALQSGGTPTDVLYDGEGNVASHTLYVTDVTGLTASNFACKKADGTYAAQKDLKITPREIIVNGVTPAKNHVYGDAITDAEKQWEYTTSDTAKQFCDDGTYLVVNIADADNNVITSNLTQVGTYDVVPELIDGKGNYTLTVAAKGVFTVDKRTVTLTVEKGLGSVYGTTPIDLMANKQDGTKYYTITNLPTGATVADVFTLSAGVTKQSAVGSYDIAIAWSDTKNYDIEYTTEQYEITPATLTAEINFAIYFGEYAPDNYDGNGALYSQASMYTVTGFVFDDENDFITNDGWRNLAYKVEGYTRGVLQDATILFDDAGKAWGNYVFAAGNVGTLTVKPLPITVTVTKDIQAVYYSALCAPSAYTVKAQASTYDGTQEIDYTVGDTIADSEIFRVVFQNYKEESAIVTNGVGNYALAVEKLHDSYTVTCGTTSCQYKIGNADFTVLPTQTENTLVYNELAQAAIADALTATRKDGQTEIEIKYLLVAGAIEGSVQSNWADNTASTGIPTVLHAHTYSLLYRIHAANHNDAYGCIAVTVQTDDNAVTLPFGYRVDGQDRTTDDAEAQTAPVWTYGEFSQSLKANFVTPTTKYHGGATTKGNPVKVTLWFSKTQGDFATAQCVLNGVALYSGDNIYDVFASAEKLGAGYYKIEYGMDAYTNAYGKLDYNATATVTRYFRIEKATLTVTAGSVDNIEYGDNVVFVAGTYDNHTTVVTGYAYEDESRTSVTYNGTAVGFTWVAAYAVGNGVGTYTIGIDDAGKYVSDNYTFTFAGGSFAVTPRVISVTVEDNKNHFNLQGDTESSTVLRSQNARLTSGKEGDAFYGSDVPFVLVTQALTPSGVATDYCLLTNNVGTYAIYAVWNASGRQDSSTEYANNYTLVFTHCSYATSQSGAVRQDSAYRATYGTNNAGTYTIESSTLEAHWSQPNSLVYNAQAKVYRVYGQIENDGQTLTIDFAATYYAVGANGQRTLLSEAPKDVGNYAVEFTFVSTSSTPNYVASKTSQTFSITKATLYVEIEAAAFEQDGTTEKHGVIPSIQYGTPLPTGNAVLSANDRFSGFRLRIYTTDSEGTRAYIGYNALLTQEGGNLTFPLAFTTAYTTSSAVTYEGRTYTVAVNRDAIESRNYNISNAAVAFTVLRRQITVTVRGARENVTIDDVAAAEKVYTGIDQRVAFEKLFTETDVQKRNATLTQFFVFADGWNGQSGDTVDMLGLQLVIVGDDHGRVLNAGTYDLRASYNVAGNYNITFATVQENTPAVYIIKQKELYLYVGGYDSTDTSHGTLKLQPQIIYGETPVLAEYLEGWVAGESYQGVLKSGSVGEIVYVGGKVNPNVYNPNEIWSNSVGTYSVRYEGTSLQYQNYFVTVKDSTFLVVSRPISAAVAPRADGQPYAYDEDNPVTPEAILFTDLFASADINSHMPDTWYRLTYTVVDGGALTAAEKQPKTAGEYEINVTLLSFNYTFVTDGKHHQTDILDFTVAKKDIPIAWDKTSLSLDSDEDKERAIDAFRSDIMTIEYFHLQLNDENAISMMEALTVNVDGILFTPDRVGRYIIRINLEDTHNYTLYNRLSEALGGDETFVLLTLVVTSAKVDLSVQIEGWTYGEYNADVNYPKYVTHNEEGAGAVSFLFAKVTRFTSLEQIEYMSFGDDEGLGEYKTPTEVLRYYFGLSGLSAFKADLPTDAGIYLVCAYASGSGNNAFMAFAVSPKVIESPVFAPDTYTYNGSQQTYEITLSDAAAVLVRADCGVRRENDKVVLYAVNAKAYAVTFALSSTTNYVWASDAVTTYTWEIEKANDTVTYTHGNISVTYGEHYAASATSGFGGTVYYLYLAGNTQPSVDAEGWLNAKPTNVGTYWVKAYTAGTANYNGGATVLRVDITPATLVATPYGTMEYNDAFSANGGENYGYTVQGFILGENSVNTLPTGAAAVQYALVDGTATDVGDYGLTLTANADGYVTGLAYRNYVVTAAVGTFTVTPKRVSITVNNRESRYGEELLLGTDGVTTDIDGVLVADLQLSLQLANTTEAIPHVGSYTIVAVCGNTNYTATVSSGVYTVWARQLYIELKGDIGGNAGSVPDVTSGDFTLIDAISKTQVTDVALYEALRFTYQHNGATIEKPTAMGNYLVSVSIVLSPQDYEIIGGSTFYFVVDRGAVDGNAITVLPAVYTGNRLTPQIDFGEYESIKECFIVSYSDDYDYTTVGMHVFTLSFTDEAFAQYKWLSRNTQSRTFTFAIERSQNAVTQLSIESWTYGDAPNAPQAEATFGSGADFVYTYYTKSGSTYTQLSGVPTDAGTYYVRVAVPESPNWYAVTGDTYVQFTIGKATLATPTLGIGEGVNDTYTGDFLWAQVNGFTNKDMEVVYDGVSNISGNVLMVQAFKAGTYTVTVRLVNDNYTWAQDGTFDTDGNVVLLWNVARKKLALPSDNPQRLVVNGKVLEYLPIGFDASCMAIEDNKSGYGGTFTAHVRLLDTDNYEWEDGTTEALPFEWKVVGVHTVFVAVMCSLGGLAFAGLIAAGVLTLMYRKKKRNEESMLRGEGLKA